MGILKIAAGCQGGVKQNMGPVGRSLCYVKSMCPGQILDVVADAQYWGSGLDGKDENSPLF